jgi:hypothetical protein
MLTISCCVYFSFVTISIQGGNKKKVVKPWSMVFQATLDAHLDWVLL